MPIVTVGNPHFAGRANPNASPETKTRQLLGGFGKYDELR